MTKLERLIKELCPNGVKNNALWELTIWDKKFNSVDKFKQKEICKYNYLLAAQLKEFESENGQVKILTTSETDLWAQEEDVTSILSEGEIVCIPWGGNPIVQYYNGKFITGDNRIARVLDTKKLNCKYLYYSLQNRLKEIASFYRGAGIMHPDMSKVLDLSIPVPPLPVQEEIVRILDELTKKTDMLISELNAELDERKKQFNYYLNACFPIESKDNRESKSLSEIGKFVRGKRFVKTDIIDTGTPCIHYGELYTYYGVWTEKAQSYLNPASSKSLRFASKNDIIIVGAGEDEWDIGIGVAWLNDEDVVIHDACYAFSHSMNPKYVSYFLRSDSYHLQIKPYVRTGKISAISSNDIGKARLLIPSLTEQELTAKLLDEFSLKYKTIIYELKTEIESRQKQYEYYRDKMLTFNCI